MGNCYESSATKVNFLSALEFHRDQIRIRPTGPSGSETEPIRGQTMKNIRLQGQRKTGTCVQSENLNAKESSSVSEQDPFSRTTSALQISSADLILKAYWGKRALAHIPPVFSWHCDMRVSLMSTLILRFTRSVQDALHKKIQPLGPLMLGDSHDRHCGGRSSLLC